MVVTKFVLNYAQVVVVVVPVGGGGGGERCPCPCPHAVSDAVRKWECSDDAPDQYPDPEVVVVVVNEENTENVEVVGKVALDPAPTAVAVSAPDLILMLALASSPTLPGSKFESSIKCASLSSCSAVNKACQPATFHRLPFGHGSNVTSRRPSSSESGWF